MKKIWVILLVGILGCTASTEPNAASETEQGKYQVLSIGDFKAKLSSIGDEVQLLDVRTADECSGGVIEKSVNIDYFSSDFQEELAKLDKTRPLLLYCRSGNRSGKAGKIATNLGFEEIYDLEGGYNAWSAQ